MCYEYRPFKFLFQVIITIKITTIIIIKITIIIIKIVTIVKPI
jgi:hypothetical protein